MITKTVTVDDAQNRFPELQAFTSRGNEVVILKGKKPLARLVPILSNNQGRVAGLNAGEIWMSDDFDEPIPENFWTS